VALVIHLFRSRRVSEQYYQESAALAAMRPRDCLLFWQKKDNWIALFFYSRNRGSSREKNRAGSATTKVERLCATKEWPPAPRLPATFGESPKW